MRSAMSLTLLGAVAVAQECYLPIDVMFLQDTTGSFIDDLPNVVKQIPNMVSSILTQNPDSRFGVVEFKDKPYYPLGIPSDFCYKLDGPLSTNVDEFQYNYKQLYASGGGELPEAQYTALVNIAQDKNVGWRPLSGNKARAGDGTAGGHVVILSTDAIPHLPGDYLKFKNYANSTIPASLKPYPADLSQVIAPTDGCRNYDYPTPDIMKAALRSQGIYLAILTPNDPAIVPAWKWVNENLLEQPADFYQFIKSDSSDLIGGVLKALKAVTTTACTNTLPPEYTTLPAPSTTTTKVTTTTRATTTTVPTTTTTKATTTTATTTTPRPTTTTAPTTTTTRATTTTVPTTITTKATTTTATTATTTTPRPTTTTAPTTTTTKATTTTVPTTTTTRATTTTPRPTTTTAPTTTTTRATTTATTTKATTTVTTARPTTTGATGIVNPQGSTQEMSTEAECPTQGECKPGCKTPAVLVRVAERPKLLHIEYEA